MSALRSRYSAALFANHSAMGVYGMLAGWLATAQPSLLTLCTTRPLAGRVLPVVLIQVREHLAMFVGMAMGILVSVNIASWLQRRRKGWGHETGRGTRCFVLMSIGMVLGSVAMCDTAIAQPCVLGIPALPAAMLAGTLFAGLAERLFEDGLPLARAAAWRSLVRPASGELTR